MNKSRCSSCNAEIYWAVTPGGKRMPLDVNPFTVAVFGHPNLSPGGLSIDGESINRFVRGYNSHFATCPQANQHRKEK